MATADLDDRAQGRAARSTRVGRRTHASARRLRCRAPRPHRRPACATWSPTRTAIATIPVTAAGAGRRAVRDDPPLRRRQRSDRPDPHRLDAASTPPGHGGPATDLRRVPPRRRRLPVGAERCSARSVPTSGCAGSRRQFVEHAATSAEGRRCRRSPSSSPPGRRVLAGIRSDAAADRLVEQIADRTRPSTSPRLPALLGVSPPAAAGAVLEALAERGVLRPARSCPATERPRSTATLVGCRRAPRPARSLNDAPHGRADDLPGRA